MNALNLNPSTELTSSSYDGLTNFNLYKDQSSRALNNRTVFPTGERTRVINPNAKPLKLVPFGLNNESQL